MASPLYKKALIVGATSGIGHALAAKLVSTGTKVIVLGRRRELLDAFVRTHGADKASAAQFDVTNLKDIPAMVAAVTKANPDLDCVFINSGIQRNMDFDKPEALKLDQFDVELTTNYSSAVHLTAAFLPHLKSQPRATLVYVSATLGLIPTLIRAANYNASKAALHHWIMAVREQHKVAGITNVKFIEVFPPLVQTELHDTKHQPELKNGHEMGMPLGEYTELMYGKLAEEHDQFAIGHGEALLKADGWETQRQKMFEEQSKMVSKNLKAYYQA